MALNWCFNEPWPAAANNSLISGDGQIKPAYGYVCRALRADMVSLRFERFDHTPDKPLLVTAFLLMDRPRPVTGRLHLTVEQDGCVRDQADIAVETTGTEVSDRIADIRLPLSNLHPGLFRVTVTPEVCCEAEIGASSYDLLLR